jgi:hypothetical protein
MDKLTGTSIDRFILSLLTILTPLEEGEYQPTQVAAPGPSNPDKIPEILRIVYQPMDSPLGI